MTFEHYLCRVLHTVSVPTLNVGVWIITKIIIYDNNALLVESHWKRWVLPKKKLFFFALQGLHSLHLYPEQNWSNIYRRIRFNLQGPACCPIISSPQVELWWSAWKDLGISQSHQNVSANICYSFQECQWFYQNGYKFISK